MVIKVKHNGEWVKIPYLSYENLQDAPSDGNQYVRQDGEWSVINVPDQFPEAPIDDKQYARKNGDWSEVVIPEIEIPELTWEGIANKPTWIGDSKPEYDVSEINNAVAKEDIEPDYTVFDTVKAIYDTKVCTQEQLTLLSNYAEKGFYHSCRKTYYSENFDDIAHTLGLSQDNYDVICKVYMLSANDSEYTGRSVMRINKKSLAVKITDQRQQQGSFKESNGVYKYYIEADGYNKDYDSDDFVFSTTNIKFSTNLSKDVFLNGRGSYEKLYLPTEIDDMLSSKVDNTDERLTDARIPLAHNHTKSDITDFEHEHTKDEITDFAHQHVKADITDFAHSHAITDITNLSTTLDNKVDVVAGKGLSTNDYDATAKGKVDSLKAVATSGDYNDLINTPTIPTVDVTKDYVDGELAKKADKSDIASVYKVKGSVANYEALPTTDVAVGDVYNLIDTGANYVATSTVPEWDKMSETVDLSGYLTKGEASTTYQPIGNYQPAGDYAVANHNHDGVYQPVGNYVLTTDSRLSDTRPANGGNADTVNNLTVLTAVPAGAVFTDTVYNDAALSGRVSTLESKAIVTTINAVGTLTGLPIDKYGIKATVSANTAISFASTPSEGSEYMIDILSPTAFTQAIPNAGEWQSDEASVDVEANKVTSISIRYIHGKYVVRV